MADNKPLFEWLGKPHMLVEPSTHSSDGLAASDLTGMPILGFDGILFVQILGATDATDVSQIQIQYSTSTAGSDAASSAATWTCTDAVFGVGPAAAAGQISYMDFRIGAKALPAPHTGTLFASVAAAETGAAQMCLIGIPYGGTHLYPTTNTIDSVLADSQE